MSDHHVAQRYLEQQARDFVDDAARKALGTGTAILTGEPGDQAAAGRLRIVLPQRRIQTPDGDLVLSGEIYIARIDIGTTKDSSRSGDRTYRVDVGSDSRIRLTVEQWFTENVRISISDRVQFGLEVGPLMVQAEVALASDPPFWLSATVPPMIIPGPPVSIQVYSGLLRVGYWPSKKAWLKLIRASEQAMKRLAPWFRSLAQSAGKALLSSAEVAATAVEASPAFGLSIPVGYGVFVVWGMAMLATDYEEGRMWGLFVQARHGYALRIACAATGTNDSYCARDVENEQWPVHRDARRVGWTAADAGWQEMGNGEREAVKSVLAGPGRGAPAVARTVFELIGGTRRTSQAAPPA